MILYNKTQNKIITKKLKVAKTFFDNLFGFLIEKEHNAILFKTRFGIHTFFMKHTVSIIILDKEYKVKVIKKELKPNRLFFWNPKYETIIEIKTTKNYRVNDKLEIKKDV